MLPAPGEPCGPSCSSSFDLPFSSLAVVAAERCAQPCLARHRHAASLMPMHDMILWRCVCDIPLAVHYICTYLSVLDLLSRQLTLTVGVDGLINLRVSVLSSRSRLVCLRESSKDKAIVLLPDGRLERTWPADGLPPASRPTVKFSSYPPISNAELSTAVCLTHPSSAVK